VPDTVATVTVADLNRSPKAFERHATVVSEVHDEVKHDPRSPPPPRFIPAVADTSRLPKSKPDTVNDAYPLCGALSCTSESTAASKVYPRSCVPATDPTNAAKRKTSVTTADDKHAKVVADVHADVRHTPSDNAMLDVKSYLAKSRPATVTELKPLTALFRSPNVSTGASKLNMIGLVPNANEPTVIVDRMKPFAWEADMQFTIVAVDQLVVKQGSDDARSSVADASAAMKLSPETVENEPLVSTIFPSSAKLRTGPSKLKIALAVPASPATVTNVALAGLYTSDAHRIVVAEAQFALPHVPSPPVKEAVDVRSRYAKLSPLIVTLPPTVRGRFGLALPETTGASKLKSLAHL